MTDQQRRIHARAQAARDAGRMEEYFKLILLAGEARTIRDKP